MSTMTDISRHAEPTEGQPAPFRELVRAEIGKILTQRSQCWLFVVAVLLAPLSAIVFCISLPVTQGQTLAQTATGDVLTASLLGIDAATIAAIVLAAIAVGSEYSTGMIAQSIAVTPDRSRLLHAKTAAIALMTGAIGAFGVILVALVAGGAIASTGREFGEIFASSGPRLLAGSILMPIFYGTLAAFLAFALRHTSGGILGSVAVLVLSAIVGWFGSDIDRILTPLTPLAGLHSISGIAGGAEDIGPLAGAVTILVWSALAYILARSRFTRKDA